jgi:hypothetical protein
MCRPERIVVWVLVMVHLMVDIENARERRDKEVSPMSLPVSSATREFVLFAKHPTTSRYGHCVSEAAGGSRNSLIKWEG